MTVLVLAPHADDETLGMGATIARYAREGRDVVVGVLTGSGEEPHPLWPAEMWTEIRAEAGEAIRVLGAKELLFEELPAVCLPETPVHQINRAVGALIAKVNPGELYLPFYHDLHQDHQAIAYAALVHARAYLPQARVLKLIAMYETPTETHLLPGQLVPGFLPNMWVDVSDTLEAKLDAWACYKSQQHPGTTPRSPEALRALATMRGAEIGAAAAEAFMVLRLRR